MKPLFTNEGMAAIDRYTIEEMGVPAEHLMNNAALRIFDVMCGRFPTHPPVLILAGPGNNGGDSIALATYLQRAGWTVDLRIITSADEHKYPTSVFVGMANKLGVQVNRHIPRAYPAEIWDKQWGIVVDALFGTGLSRDLSKDYARIVEALNRYRARNACSVISIDTPSGLCAATGRVFGACVKADITITIEHDKLGFHNYSSADHLGEVVIVKIGFPAELAKKADSWKIETSDVAAILPVRNKKSHKGTFGKVLVIGGGRGMTGAAQMVARAALRSGAGMVKLVVPEAVLSEVSAVELEVMVDGALDTESGFFSRLAQPRILEISEWADVIALGSGIGREPQTLELVRDILAKSPLPAVLDADGILALENKKPVRPDAPLGITPHPGEFAMMTGLTSEEISNDPFGTAREFVKDAECSVAFKAGESFTVDRDGRIYYSPTGNPGMATAGSGDVLTGIIAGILAPFAAQAKAQGAVDLDKAMTTALWAGQFVHGLSGDIASGKTGMDGLIASDILDSIPAALKAIRGGAAS